MFEKSKLLKLEQYYIINKKVNVKINQDLLLN